MKQQVLEKLCQKMHENVQKTDLFSEVIVLYLDHLLPTRITKRNIAKLPNKRLCGKKL